MKKWLLGIVCGAMLVLLPYSAQAAAGYVLRPGDALDISVMGFDELNTKQPAGLVIRPDGTISFPFLGEVAVEGLTVGELSQNLTERLKKYYNNPIVTVNLIKFTAMRVYVLGEVNKPGLYELDRSRNLVDAIGMAGGWTKDAAKKKVLLIHADSSAAPTKINLLEYLRKGHVSQNPALREGDVIYLSENGRINFTTDVLPYVSTAFMLRYYNRNSD